MTAAMSELLSSVAIAMEFRSIMAGAYFIMPSDRFQRLNIDRDPELSAIHVLE